MKRRLYSKNQLPIFLLILIWITVNSNAIGQNNGTFSGRVIDKTTSESLIGAKYFF